MLSQYEVPAFIAGKLPQVSNDLSRNGVTVTAAQSIQVLADFTKRMAFEHNIGMVQKCMLLVQHLYEKGNILVKNAVENIFVFSFSTLMSHCNIAEWKILRAYMPPDLYSLYVHQILKSNC